MLELVGSEKGRSAQGYKLTANLGLESDLVA